MTKRILRWGSLATLLLMLARPAQSAPGTNIRWIDCIGDGGLVNRYFACNTNTGFEILVGSFELGADMPNVSGLEIVIDIASRTSPLPAWWQFKNTGSCRATSLSVSTAPPGTASACLDWGGGQVQGGIGAYALGSRGPETARLIMAFAVPPSGLAALTTGQEYFAFLLRIQHAKTVGTGACGGCCTPVNVVFNSIKVTTLVPADDRTLSGPTNGTDSFLARWQGGFQTFAQSGTMAAPPCGETVPTLSRTWSELKALYR